MADQRQSPRRHRRTHLWCLRHESAWGKRADDQEKCFSTEANGAAMRVAPHVIVHHEGSFGDLATDVVRDATTTHGHPRALLGALVHAYALWTILGLLTRGHPARLTHRQRAGSPPRSLGSWC
ncbi:ADP-ribosylglycohydrolase family protein [Streptomyces sp. RPT161]|uniref:ADP-ribosylglycohydrolase family protein n=1 Tax=Streptomyces sp. RPT161 TaxID=3015993 RepID=UPI003FCD4993